MNLNLHLHHIDNNWCLFTVLMRKVYISGPSCYIYDFGKVFRTFSLGFYIPVAASFNFAFASLTLPYSLVNLLDCQR